MRTERSRASRRLPDPTARRRGAVDQEGRLSGPLMRLTTLGTGTAAPCARARAERARRRGRRGPAADGLRQRRRDAAGRPRHAVAGHHAPRDHALPRRPRRATFRRCCTRGGTGNCRRDRSALEIIGPVGTVRLLSRFAGVFGDGLLALGFPISVREMAPGDGVDAGRRRAPAVHARFRTPRRAWHIPSSARGRRIVYTGDTGPGRDARRVGRGVRRAAGRVLAARRRWRSRRTSRRRSAAR